VGRDQHPSLFGNRRQTIAKPVIDRFKAAHEVGSPRLVVRPAGGIEFRERLDDGGHAEAPESGVEPDMRIVEVVGHGQEPVAGQRVGYERYGDPPRQSREQFRQLAFQVQSRGNHQFRPGETVGIAGCRPVGMRVDASRHQAVDRHPVAADLPDKIGHDGRRGHDGTGRLVCPRGRQGRHDNRDGGYQTRHQRF